MCFGSQYKDNFKKKWRGRGSDARDGGKKYKKYKLNWGGGGGGGGATNVTSQSETIWRHNQESIFDSACYPTEDSFSCQ